MIRKFLSLILFLISSDFSLQNPALSNNLKNHHLSQKNYYFHVIGSLQNSNNVSLSDISVILSFPDWNRTFTNVSDINGTFNISDSLPNVTMILIGEISFIDPKGIYAQKSFEVTLYLGNAYTVDLGKINLVASSPNLTNIAVYGYIYSSSKPVANTSILIQAKIANSNNVSNVSILQILNSSGVVADIVNISSLNNSFLSSNETTYIAISDQKGSFQFYLSNANLLIQYDIKLLAMKQYYKNAQTEVKIVNMSETSILMNMTAQITQGKISGRFTDEFNKTNQDVDMTYNCTGGYTYYKNGLEINSDGYFSFIVANISMLKKKISCNVTFNSKGYLPKHMRNIKLYRSQNYTKNLHNVTINHQTVKAYVHGYVYNNYGVLNDALLNLNIENSLNSSKVTNYNLTTSDNGSFALNFKMILYSQVNCTINFEKYGYHVLSKFFQLNELNNYAKFFKNITLKVEQISASISGILFDPILNSSISHLQISLQSLLTNRSFYILSKNNGTFKYSFTLAKPVNYSFLLTINAEYFFPYENLIFLNETNNFTDLETINLTRETTKMIIFGCVSSNFSNVSAFVTENKTNNSFLISNSTFENGCFIFETLVFQGLKYNVIIYIISEEYYNFSTKLELSSYNNYTIDMGNVSLLQKGENLTINGTCVLNSSNQTLSNVLIVLALKTTDNLTRIIYKDKSEKNGKFQITINLDSNTTEILMIMSKKGLNTVEMILDVDVETKNEMDLGLIYLEEK